jgi:hypothetical protein
LKSTPPNSPPPITTLKINRHAQIP